MQVEIPYQLLVCTGLSAQGVLLEAALALFGAERITLGQTAELVGLHQFQMQQELARRDIPIQIAVRSGKSASSGLERGRHNH